MNLIRENTIDSLKDNKIQNFSGIKIQEMPFVNKINLRINPENTHHISSLGKILEVILPTKPNTYIQKNGIKIIWLGPDEWLLVDNIKNHMFEKLKNNFDDVEASLTDVSENRTIIRISGEKIYTLLSKFLFLNLESNLSNQLSCAQTLFAKVPVLLVRNNNDNQIPEIDIFTNRSYANYVYNLIVDGTKYLNF